MTITGIDDINIMFSIMIASNYIPFIDDIKPILREVGTGAIYTLYPPDNYNLIAIYARQFLNDNQ